ncbi:uncharacterized protein LOC123306904 [Coccinella septempunctata]|uniref:uncharacterized protein LOC123306904 n=1 Tax=Coccinella septempunctata TaxID=41139 RepID=UPI001D05E4DA|nr:uncharacterized protein LOC123306904 [Coccinella septempunctata]
MPGGRWECVNCRSEDGTTPSPAIRASPPPDRRLSVEDDAGDGVVVGPDDLGASRLLFSVKNDVAAMRNDIKELRNSVTFCSGKITDFEQRISKLHEVVKLANQVKMENDLLKKEVTNLQTRLDSVEQNLRLNNVEITDIPEKNNENLIEIVRRVGEFMEVEVEPSAISSVSRTRITNKPKNIVVTFISKAKRDEMLSAVKVKRNQLERKDGFKLDGLSNKFYVNEHLTIRSKIIFKAARVMAREKGFKFVWTQNGNILMRKNDTSRILHIRSEADLAKLS